MKLLTEHEADCYTEASKIEFTHTVEHAIVYIGKSKTGVKYVLLMDGRGLAVLSEAT